MMEPGAVAAIAIGLAIIWTMMIGAIVFALRMHEED